VRRRLFFRFVFCLTVEMLYRDLASEWIFMGDFCHAVGCSSFTSHGRSRLDQPRLLDSGCHLGLLSSG